MKADKICKKCNKKADGIFIKIGKDQLFLCKGCLSSWLEYRDNWILSAFEEWFG